MPRTRSIKPEFWSDEKLSQISMNARLLFIGMWTYSDDYGVVKGNIRWLKSMIFPYEEISIKKIETWIDELIKLQRILPFKHSGETYFFIPNFLKHQTINRPSKNRNPEPPQNILAALNDDSLSTHALLTDETETETETETNMSKTTLPKPNGFDDRIHSILQNWNQFAERMGLATIRSITPKRRQKLRSRLKEKQFDFPAILTKIENSDFLLGLTTNWRVDFDFIIHSQENYLKILEGKYENNPKISKIGDKNSDPETLRRKQEILRQNKIDPVTLEIMS